MKKLLTCALTLALTAALLAGCTGGSSSDAGSGSGAGAKTPEELAQLYSTAITENGGELVEYNPVFTAVSQEDMSAMILEAMGLAQEDMQAFGISSSLMNVQAYGIAAVMPAQDKTEAVTQALQGYIDAQKASFEHYLADQYEVAGSARLETLEDGTVLMVMCEGQDAVFEAISQAILAG